MAKTKLPDPSIKPVKDYYDESGAHIRIFPAVGTKEDQERAKQEYIRYAIELQVRRATEAMQANSTLAGT